MPLTRRNSTNVGDELRGDTGASALSTLEPTPNFTSPPLTPTGSVSEQCSLRAFAYTRIDMSA